MTALDAIAIDLREARAAEVLVTHRRGVRRSSIAVYMADGTAALALLRPSEDAAAAYHGFLETAFAAQERRP